ncbi:hypothetical protein [Streptosporangium sp. KLBMP 9127]|nr:hypothetical protein [Streptosporangium sp. KLBMP 9127]
MAAEDVVRSLQQLQRRLPAGARPPAFIEDIAGPTPQADGTDLYSAALVAPTGVDLSIPIGSWTLRLIPVGTGTARVAVRMFFPGGSDDFDRIEVDLGRFELISDPRDLVPADLVTDPYVRLVPNPALGTVRLLGPGLTLVLAGAGLTDVSARFTGANGSADPRFPSARFVPPHFLIAGTDLGLACDEVLLDLNGEIDPENLDNLTGVASDGTFTGVILQELGLFVGDPNEVGTWSGIARVHDFVMRFDPMEITGTFEGELVHAVAPDAPQVAVVVSFRTDSGQRVDAAEVDPTVPAPIAPEVARKVRLVATPSWASAGFQVKWTLPAAAELENPERVNQPDLGWMRLPPGAHTFKVDVTDHRVNPVSAQRTVLVQHPPPTPATAGLKADLVATVDQPAGGSQAVRLYVPLVPGQRVALVLEARRAPVGRLPVPRHRAGECTGGRQPLGALRGRPRGDAQRRGPAPARRRRGDRAGSRDRPRRSVDRDGAGRPGRALPVRGPRHRGAGHARPGGRRRRSRRRRTRAVLDRCARPRGCGERGGRHGGSRRTAGRVRPRRGRAHLSRVSLRPRRLTAARALTAQSIRCPLA